MHRPRAAERRPPRSPLLIIGVGRTDHGDDAAGLLAAERLRALAPPGTTVAGHRGETTALIDRWLGHAAVVLVDATDLGAPVGTLSRFDDIHAPIATRHLNPPATGERSATVFELARAIGRLPERLLVLGIEGQRFDPHTPPSPALLGALDGSVERLLVEVGAFGAAAAGRLG